MTDAEWAQFQELAAGYARSCDIVTAADKLAEQLGKYIVACTTPSRTISPDYSLSKLKAVLEAFKVVRNGQ